MNQGLRPLMVCMAAAYATFAVHAAAAPPVAGPNPPENPTTTPTPATPPMGAVLPAPPKEFLGLAWGGFLLYPEASLSLTYDDNIYAERTDVTDDVVMTLSPSLEVKSNWARHALNFDLGGDFDRYRSHDSENVNDAWLGADGRYDLSPRTNVFGGARHTRDHEDRSAPGSVLTQTEPTRYDHDEAHLGLAHAFGAFRLRAGGTWDRYDYRDGVTGAGAVVDNDYRDHALGSLGARLGYVLSPRYEVFGQFATDTRDYDGPIAGQTFNRDSDGYRAAAGLAFTLPRVRGEAYAGVMHQAFDHAGFSDLTRPYFGALVSWKATRLTTATGFIDRSLEETTVSDGLGGYASSSLDTTYGFEVERRLSSRLSVNGRAAYTTSDFQNFDRRDTVIDAGAGLRYYVWPTVFMAVDLRIVDRDSDTQLAQYSRNQVLLSIGYTPARKRDYAIIAEPEPGVVASPTARGLFSGWYGGAQLEHGGLVTATRGPRGGGGFDSGDMGAAGGGYGVFAGWGREYNDAYFGVEIDGGDSQADWYHRKDKPDSVTTFVDKGTSYGLNLRAGYLLDGGLLYGKLGVVRTDFHTYYAENQFVGGAFDRKHTETGTRVGIGLEIPASRTLFVRTDYTHTRYDGYDVPYESDVAATTTEIFDIDDSVFSVGLGWRFGGARPAVVTRAATGLRGFHAGAHLGHGTLASDASGTHDIGDVPGDFAFIGDFARTGFTGGFFAGYGHTFARVYAGIELEAEASNLGWYHDRETSGSGGRDFAVEKRGSYGAALRIGYVLDNGGLLYGRVGAVRTRFNTIYNRGANAANWIDRSDTLAGTRFGLGAEMPASRHSFVRMDYSYTRYADSIDFVTGHATPDAMRFENSESLVRLGLGFRF